MATQSVAEVLIARGTSLVASARSDRARPTASRRLYRPGAEDAAARAGRASREPRPDEDEQEASLRQRRRSWARLIARIYEVDPLTCPRCGHELKVVAAITDPRVIDRILEHRRRVGLRSPFEPRALERAAYAPAGWFTGGPTVVSPLLPGLEIPLETVFRAEA